MRQRLESRIARLVYRQLRRDLREILDAIRAGVDWERILQRIGLPREVGDAMAMALLRSFQAGAMQFVQAAPQATVNWQLVNSYAQRWAQEYVGELIRRVDETSRQIVREEIARWIASGQSLQTLVRNERLQQLFGAPRARVIAVTEVTRAYAEGNMALFRETGITHRRWNTSVDERVCPICAPLNGVVTGVHEPFPGGVMLPPAHPNCRCWITPVVEE